MSTEASSKYFKLQKRVKIAVGRSKNSRDNAETLDSNRNGVRGNKNAQSRKPEDNNASSVDDKLHKEENSRRIARLNTRDQNSRTDKRENGGKSESSGRMSERINNRDQNIRVDKGENNRRRSERTNARDQIRTDKGENGERRSERLNTKEQNIRTEKGENSGRRNERIITRDKNTGADQEEDGDRKRGFKRLNSNLEQKRVYAEPGHAKADKSKSSNKKDFPKAGWNKLKDDYVKENRTNSTTRRRSKENESLDLKDGASLRAKGETVYKGRNVGVVGNGDGMLEKDSNRKSKPNNQLDWGKNKRADDSVAFDDRRKKKKRGIRLDPHDITNKRLDDSIANNDNTEEKKEDSEEKKSVEMSMNAQFRAIQPSHSILSFVEENLLGRRREIELRRAGYNTELSVPLDNIPSSTSSERERIEETVFRNKLEFFAAAKVSSSLPPPDLPEIAFAGRSNVGKSSLLNALTRQWGVVRTSDKPGLTQTINFFKLGPKLCLVDLPGYGFAYAKEEVKEAWEELVKEYVSTRVGLKRVCLLIDTKWGMKPRDHELINLMERSQTKYQIVLTKTDTVFPIDVARRAMQIEESLKANKSAVQPVMMVSSTSGAGIRSLRTALSRIARFVKL